MPLFMLTKLCVPPKHKAAVLREHWSFGGKCNNQLHFENMHIYTKTWIVCAFVCVCGGCLHVHMKPEINLKIISQVLPMLILESNSLMNLLSRVGCWPVNPSDLVFIIIFAKFLFFIDSKKSSLVSYWWNINMILIKPNLSK